MSHYESCDFVSHMSLLYLGNTCEQYSLFKAKLTKYSATRVLKVAMVIVLTPNAFFCKFSCIQILPILLVRKQQMHVGDSVSLALLVVDSKSDWDKHPTALVFWHTPFRTNTTTEHVFFFDTVDCLNECVSIWLLGWVNCYWVLKSFDEKLLSVVEWWVCGGVWGAASPAPLPSLIERHCCWRRWRWWLGSTLGSKL